MRTLHQSISNLILMSAPKKRPVIVTVSVLRLRIHGDVPHQRPIATVILLCYHYVRPHACTQNINWSPDYGKTSPDSAQFD